MRHGQRQISSTKYRFPIYLQLVATNLGHEIFIFEIFSYALLFLFYLTAHRQERSKCFLGTSRKLFMD